MIHTFIFDNKYFAYDVFSSSLMIVDEASYKVMGMYASKTRYEIHERLDARFGVDEINQILDELDELKADEVILSTIDYKDVEPTHDGHIKALCLHIAHDCNLRCKYCFASTGSFGGKRSLMSVEVGCNALDFLFEHSGNIKNLEVDFFGGEPLMNMEAVKEIVAYGRKLEEEYNKIVNFTITTNAFDVDDETMQYLNREMHNIVISIDGREDIHDYMRPTIERTGSHSTILANAKKFVELRGNKSHYIRGTFTKHNLDFKKDVQYFYDQGFRQISIEPVVANEAVGFALNESHLDAICNEYEELAKWYIDMRNNGKWLNFFHFFIDLETGPCATKRLSGCGAGCEYVAITPDGDIYPCHQFTGDEQFKLGNISDGNMDKDIRARFEKNSVSDKEDCKICWAQLWCGGGCCANAYSFNNSLSKPYELACEMQLKRLECALAIYAIENYEEDN